MIKRIKGFIEDLRLDYDSWTSKWEKDENYINSMRNETRDFNPYNIAMRIVKPNSRVLSAGSGPGREVAFLSRIKCKITAIDRSEKMIELSKKMGKAEYIKGDIVKFERPGTFDYVLCLFSTINFLPNLAERRKFIEKSWVNLKNGGKLIILTAHMFSNWRTFIRSLLQINKNYYYYPLQINRWFENINFKVEKIRLKNELLILATKT